MHASWRDLIAHVSFERVRKACPGRLPGAQRHCSTNRSSGQTCAIAKRVVHGVQGWRWTLLTCCPLVSAVVDPTADRCARLMLHFQKSGSLARDTALVQHSQLAHLIRWVLSDHCFLGLGRLQLKRVVFVWPLLT